MKALDLVTSQLRIARRRIRIAADRWLLPAPRHPELVAAISTTIRSLDLVMVSQIQRSGGTLLSQLLDGHPELWVYPGEIHIAKPKDTWPRIPLWLPPAIIFRKLVDHRCIEYARHGFRKSMQAGDAVPFDYDVGLHAAAFRLAMSREKPATQRQVLDIFFSTFFASWLNRKSSGEPRFICAFAADFAVPEYTVQAFFADYPNGKLISVLRDPSSWTSSALNKTTSRRKFATADRAIAYWRRSTDALIRNKSRWPDRVLLTTFADLVGATPVVIRQVADFIGVTMTDSLLRPTFNSEMTQSNSSFSAVIGVVDKSILDRSTTSSASPADLELYETAQALCVRPADPASS